MRYLLPVAFLCVLAGCKTAPTLQTFDGLLLTAGTVEDAVVIATDAMLKAGTLTGTQATRVLKITDQVQANLVLARSAYQLGNQATAATLLAGANAMLTKAQACTTAPNATTTIDACLGSLQ